MSSRSHNDAFKALTEMGVEIKLHMQVKDYMDDVVVFSNGETIATKTLVWAAGITGFVFSGMPPDSYGSGKRILVDEFNRVKGLDKVFVISPDSRSIAYFTGAKAPRNNRSRAQRRRSATQKIRASSRSRASPPAWSRQDSAAGI